MKDTQADLDEARKRGVEAGKQRSYEWFVQAICDYEEGCWEEKIKFIESIGLERYLPEREWTVEIRVTASASIDEYNVEQMIDNALSGEDFSDYSIDVRES